jgi:hypothetical protein
MKTQSRPVLAYAHYVSDDLKTGKKGSVTFEKPASGSPLLTLVYKVSNDLKVFATTSLRNLQASKVGGAVSLRNLKKVRNGQLDMAVDVKDENRRTTYTYQTVVDDKNKYSLSVSASGGPVGVFKKDEERKAHLKWDVSLDDIDALQVKYSFASDNDVDVKLTHRVDDKWSWDATYHYKTESFSANLIRRIADDKSLKIGGNFRSKAYQVEYKVGSEDGGPYILTLKGLVDENTKLRDTLNQSEFALKKRFDF